MNQEVNLAVIDGETLMDLRLEPTRFCVDTLLPQGLCILGGAPKIGKSWLVLDLCVRIAKGESIWELPTKQGTTLYLCLEDPLRRVQERLCQITDEVPANAFFSVCAVTLAEGLCSQLQTFVLEHPDTVLVVIDTFQIVREQTMDASYASDYDEVRKLKALADDLGITVLLVHHLRKQGDSDPLNKLSGTTGISGGVDAVFVLDKSKRSATGATLVATGQNLSSKGLKQMMNRWRFPLEALGVTFRSHRSNGQRLVEVHFSSAGDASDGSDGNPPGAETSVPFVPCDPGSPT